MSGIGATLGGMSDQFKPPHPDEIPASVDDALAALLDIIPGGDLARIAAMDDHKIDALHFGLGAAIRNQFGLWNPKSPLLAAIAARTGRSDPDDASMELIRLLWTRLRVK